MHGLVAEDDLFNLNSANIAPEHKTSLLQIVRGLGDKACHLLYMHVYL